MFSWFARHTPLVPALPSTQKLRIECGISHCGLQIAALVFLTVAGCLQVRAQNAAALPPLTTPAQEQRVESLLGQLTQEEKISLIGGTGFGTRGVPRLGIPAFKMNDGPYGVRAGKSTVIPGGIGLAASWNVDLARREGEVVGEDGLARGTNFQLAPAVNIVRAPQDGRDFEYFGEDPFLSAAITVGYIEGLQSQHVSATVKHFIANDSEYSRNYTDAIIDDRTLHEIYLPPFEAAVKQAHTGAVMDSYNLLDGEYTSANHHLNVDILKKQFGFEGLVMSDWASTHDPLGPAAGGLDLEMPFAMSMNSRNIAQAIASGKLTQAELDDKVRRLLRTAVRFGWLDEKPGPRLLPILNENGRDVALEGAEESMVLLKNEGGILPLRSDKPLTVALIGPEAYPLSPVGGGSAQASPYHAVSLLEGLSAGLGAKSAVLYSRGLPEYSKVVQNTFFSTDAEGRTPGVQYEAFDNRNLEGTPSSSRIDAHITMGRALDMGNLAGGGGDAPGAGGNPFGGGGVPGGGPPFGAGAARPGGASRGARAPAPGGAGPSGRADFLAMMMSRTSEKSFRWTGYYTPQSPGPHHVIIAQSGGGEATGYRIFIDDKLVQDDWAFPKAIVDDFAVDLSTGAHKVVVEFWARYGFASPMFSVGIKRDGTWVDPEALAMAATADVVVLSVGFDPSTEFEGWDRTFHLPPGQDELVATIAARNPHSVVLLQGGGNVAMEDWLPRVPALLHTWYPGQEGGTAITAILMGRVSPSGHLPVTFERRPQDNPTFGHYYPTEEGPKGTHKVVYSEGVFVGYRGYQKSGIAPLFPFGFGLSYTTFKLSHLQVTPAANAAGGTLFNAVLDVSNTGRRKGKAVVQLYVAPGHSSVDRPAEELKAFTKVELAPGQTRRVILPLTPRSFSYYDSRRKQWVAQSGTYQVRVGQSSTAIELTAPVHIEREIDSN